MNEAIIYFRVNAKTENGESQALGVKLSLGQPKKTIEYDKLANSVNKAGIIQYLHLDELGVTPNDLHVISPEEYTRDFGED